MKGMRIDRARFMELFAAEEAARTNGKTNGKKHPKGAWVEEDTYETTINTMFWDGPPCMWIISHRKCHDMKNNFLVDVSTFLKKKYPENWDKALEWVNYNVLQPVGDRDKLADIIKRVRGHEYEYMCQQEPICSFCDPHACRRKPYGVGNVNGVDHYEWGMTKINRIPHIFIINIGDHRIVFEANELLNQNKYQEKCLEHGVSLTKSMKKDEWINLLNKNLENATIVEPTRIMRTNAAEIDFMTTWLSIHVPAYMRVGSKGTEDTIRVKVEEGRIYFKDYKLMRFCAQCSFDDKAMRRFIDANCQYNDRTTHREWWRSTYSIALTMFDEEIVEKWMSDAGADNDKYAEAGDDSGSSSGDAVRGSE
jgi:hypothetical protein